MLMTNAMRKQIEWIPPSNEVITFASWLSITSPITNWVWAAHKFCLPRFPECKEEIVSAMFDSICLAAEVALPTWEAYYPDDGRPRKAIQTARIMKDDPSPDNRVVADAASRAATSAACQNQTFYNPLRAAALAGDAARIVAWSDATSACPYVADALATALTSNAPIDAPVRDRLMRLFTDLGVV